MRPMRLFAMTLLPALGVATVAYLVASVFDVVVLGNCDAKLGCWGAVQVGAVFVAIISAACGIALGCFALASQALSARSASPQTLSFLSAASGLAIAAFFTSHIWGRP